MMKRFLFFGAHPDDAEVAFGGTAALLAKAGHIVQFVSVTNGDAGHHIMPPEALAKRRRRETLESARIGGIAEYQVLNHPDGRLENSVAIREELIRIIREFRPDVVISHRICDYHPDHRNTAQMVLDTSFVVGVPHIVPEVPVPEVCPVYAYCQDFFTDPRPFRLDAVSCIDSVLDTKYRMLDCHKSQFYEWLPWVDFGRVKLDADAMSWEERREWLDKNWGKRFCVWAERAGIDGKYAEAVEQSAYGRQVSAEEFRKLFQP